MKNRMDMVRESLDRLHQAAAAIERDVVFMEVCGTHTMSAFRTGLHSLMPKNVKLLSGPGCPVCVTAQGDIDLLIELAMDRDVTLCTYGDMMRVPGRRGSLATARGQGADVRVVYSVMDAVRLAEATPKHSVVFAAVGFETTAPTAAAAILEAERRGLDNFSVLASHKRVLPAMTALLEGGQVKLDGFMCPGHVSVVIGSDVYRPIVEKYGKACVIGGFEDMLMAAALAALTEQVRDGAAKLVNLYPQAVTRTGNAVAQKLIQTVYKHADVRWRGLGVIPDSGLVVRSEYGKYDAMRRYELAPPRDREIRGCICGRVITGMAQPQDCKLFGRVCTPIAPVGPCMVSSEGTCAAHFKYNRNGAGCWRQTTQEVKS